MGGCSRLISTGGWRHGRFGSSSLRCARGAAMSSSIAIVGDRFMLPSVFAERIAAACGNGVNIRTLEQPWPDEPMEHGYAGSPLDGLKEFMGHPDDVAAFIGDAALLVTHLAPISRPMLERLPGLRFIAVSRGGPVNIDLKAARDHNVLVVNTPGRNASAVAEFTVGAILAETRLIRSGHEALRAGEWRGDLYRADRTGRELGEMTVGIVGYGRLGGAALDTSAVEPPPPDWPLLQLPSVTLTPHIAGASVRTVTVAADQVAEEVRRFLAGERPLNPC